MCGIAGIVNRNGRPADELTIRRITDLVRHRGPDGVGVYTCGSLGLGHRRLAIIDLSDAANQPMQSKDGRLTITFNGEVYNYLELREELKKDGHFFFTNSDTEVILAAYAQWGTKCVNRFNGMWAFAIHDRQTQTLFCSRDRFGVKPFYYVDNEELFAFGSEIKQLLTFLRSPRANRDLLLTFLTTGLVNYAAETFFEGVKKLEPGHNLCLDMRTGTVERLRYYHFCPAELNGASPSEIERQFSDLFHSSVELRLRSDVPVGTCLSGGIDSSAIAALASGLYHEKAGGPFCAVTAGSIAPEIDESGHAKQMAESNGMRWLMFKPSVEDFAAVMNDVVYHQDEPFPSLSPLMQYFVMRLARENDIAVLLDGQGADEALLGYSFYFGMQMRLLIRQRGVLAALRAMREAVAQNERLTTFVAAKYTLGNVFPSLRYRWAKRDIHYLTFSPKTPQVLRDHAAAYNDLQTFQAMEISLTTLPALLRYEDRNSMAFGVETRLPFLDYRMMEFALGLPLDHKIRDGWTKWILRRSMRGRVPNCITWRRDKIGFEGPDSIWISKYAATMRGTILASDLVHRIADGRKLKSLLPTMSERQLWRLFSISTWASTFGVTEFGSAT